MKTLKPKFTEIMSYLVTKDRGFQAGLVIKLILSLFFASHFITDLFAPFIKDAIQHNFFQVYQRFSTQSPDAFPYPPVMLYVLAVPRWLLSLVAPVDMSRTHIIDLFAIRLPLLLADISIAVILIKWLKKPRLVTLWYWFNPILIYVTYIHGQLDLLPVALLCLSLYYFIGGRYLLSVILIALATAAKFSMIVAAPFMLMYLIRTRKVSGIKIAQGTALFAVLVLLLNLPFLSQPGYRQMVYENAEQGKILLSYINLFSNYQLLFIPAAYLVVLYAMYGFRFLNRDILLIFVALCFGIFTFFIAPRQGWYLWNMPFFIYFLIRFKQKYRLLFIALNVAYFLFFIISPISDFPEVAQMISPSARSSANLYHVMAAHGMNSYTLFQLCFTLLQTSLFLFCFSIFKEGIWQTKKYKVFNQPYLIGICGDSGSGKSVLSDNIGRLIGDGNTLIIRGDDMHRWERGHQKWTEFTHLNPMANWLHKDISQLTDLKSGKSILRSTYDHHTGKFTKPFKLHPNKMIIYEGLHTFYLKGTDKIYDLKIFMKPDEGLRRYWKTERDVGVRGYSTEKVLKSIESRAADSIKYIDKQEKDADIVFSMRPMHPDEEGASKFEADNLVLNVRCTNDIYFESLIDGLREIPSLRIIHNIDETHQEIRVEGSITIEEINRIGKDFVAELEDIFEHRPQWQHGASGIMQLFIGYYTLAQFEREGIINQDFFHQ